MNLGEIETKNASETIQNIDRNNNYQLSRYDSLAFFASRVNGEDPYLIIASKERINSRGDDIELNLLSQLLFY